jgi:2-amino-4-hydroxy-6-hydroxymethyldihydropteridine diphosphokinase
MGDREKNLCDAVSSISGIEGINIIKCSRIYETEPVGYLEQPQFLNMVISISTKLPPVDLLNQVQAVETAMKRTREIRWGPRTIDIDILIYGDIFLETPELTIPHPRMYQRAFVLVPFKEIYPFSHVNGKEISNLISMCSDKEGVKLYK